MSDSFFETMSEEYFLGAKILHYSLVPCEDECHSQILITKSEPSGVKCQYKLLRDCL